MDQWAPEDVEAHMAFLKHVGELLEENGEYVDAARRRRTPSRGPSLPRRAAICPPPAWPTRMPPVGPQTSPSATT
jgi:hypothetical protein